MKKIKLLSFILSIIMLTSLINLTVFAETTDTETDVTINENNDTTDVLPPEILIIYNIAQKYSDESILNDSNFYWFLADLADYQKVFNETDFVLNQSQKQLCLDKIIDFSKTATAPGDLSKAIIAMRSLGYDAKNVTTSNFESLDIVAKLSTLVDEQASSVTNVYTLPYVIIALNQGENYATEEQMQYLINTAVSNKSSWHNTQFGTDAMTPMILALSPYYNTNESVKEAINEAITILRNSQDENGLIGNAPSTGLSIAALSAIGIDAETVINNNSNIIDGLMSQATETLDAFNPTNYSFATEQGFRGLIAWQLAKQNKRIFDFKEFPMSPAVATWYESCPVSFNVTPIDATVTIDSQTPLKANDYDLGEGTYNYTVSKSGYISQSGTITVTNEDVLNHTLKSINISLDKESSSGSSSSSNRFITVNLKVMTHNADDCLNNFTYRENASDYTAIVDKSIKVIKGTSVYEILTNVLENNSISFTEKDAGYISSINEFGEFDHGENSGWLFTVNGKKVKTSSIDTIINSTSKIVWFYTDNYMKEDETFNEDIDNTSSPSSDKDIHHEEKQPDNTDNTNNTNNTDNSDNITPPVFTTTTFSDVSEKSWFYDSVKYVYENNLMQGTDNGFEPEAKMTRAMIVTVLYRLENPEKTTGNISFLDIEDNMWYSDAVLWATENQIVNGIGNSLFAPNSPVTREQLSQILWRYAQLNKTIASVENSISEFDDQNDVSNWAIDAMNWAVSEKIINGTSENRLSPKATATRAEIATILMRFSNIQN